jgi:hypothetical protein
MNFGLSRNLWLKLETPRNYVLLGPFCSKYVLQIALSVSTTVNIKSDFEFWALFSFILWISIFLDLVEIVCFFWDCSLISSNSWCWTLIRTLLQFVQEYGGPCPVGEENQWWRPEAHVTRLKRAYLIENVSSWFKILEIEVTTSSPKFATYSMRSDRNSGHDSSDVWYHFNNRFSHFPPLIIDRARYKQKY